MRHLSYPDAPYHALLSTAAERWPEKIALRAEERTYSYAQLNGLASRMANALLSLGLEPGDRLALFLPNCPEYEIAFFGAARAGIVPTPLNPSYKEREVRYQIEDSGSRAAVVHASLYPTLEAARRDLPSLTQVIVVGAADAGAISFEDLIRDQPDTDPGRTIAMDSLAALPYSSGTTGRAKGVMLTQRNLVCNAMQFVDCTQSTDQDSLLIFLPLYHIYGVALMATAIGSGAEQVLLERFELARVVQMVEEGGVTELFVVPPVMLALANAPDLWPERFRSLRFIMSAAAPLAAEVARSVAERLKVPVIQAYGMTESSPMTHMVPLDRWFEVLGTVGVVAADTECRVIDLDGSGQEVPSGEVGEITVAGPQVMLGYWHAPEATAETLSGKWLRTGDLGSVDDAGNFSVVDRVKEMIKYKAFSIAPAELESLLLEHPAVRDCAVLGRPDPEAGEVPCAFVVIREGTKVDGEELRAFVAERVAGYKQIRKFEIVEAIPRTPSGKILRRVLKDQMRASSLS